MKIAVDAHVLSSPMSGVGRYLTEIYKRLVLKGIDVKLYTYKRIHTDYCLVVNESDVVRCGYGCGRLIWFEIILPFRIAKYNSDIFWGVSHKIPIVVGLLFPSVVTIHDMTWKFFPSTMRFFAAFIDRIYMYIAIRLSCAIVIISKSTASAVKDHYKNSERKIFHIYPGSNLQCFNPPRITESKFSSYGKYFIFVGTIEPRKNLQRLINAYLSLDHDVRSIAKFLIVGNFGWGKPLYLPDTSDIVFEHCATDLDLTDAYKYSQFLVMPSLYEGFGLPLVEAMHFGKPVLTSNLLPMSEIVGDAGVLVDPTSTESIKNGLFILLTSETLRTNLAASASLRAVCFDWDLTTESIYSLFCSVLSIESTLK